MSCSVTDEMHEIVHEAAEPSVAGERVSAAITRAARALGIPFSRARAHWYKLARLVPAEEADALRARRQALRDARITQLENELAALVALRRGTHGHDGVDAGAFRRHGDEARPAMRRPGTVVLPDRREAA